MKIFCIVLILLAILGESVNIYNHRTIENAIDFHTSYVKMIENMHNWKYYVFKAIDWTIDTCIIGFLIYTCTQLA